MAVAQGYHSEWHMPVSVTFTSISSSLYFGMGTSMILLFRGPAITICRIMPSIAPFSFASWDAPIIVRPAFPRQNRTDE